MMKLRSPCSPLEISYCSRASVHRPRPDPRMVSMAFICSFSDAVNGLA